MAEHEDQQSRSTFFAVIGGLILAVINVIRWLGVRPGLTTRHSAPHHAPDRYGRRPTRRAKRASKARQRLRAD